ncbi:hypothetical protein HC864_05255 [Candidatus Gracilibacteria bacterium]|nr:hypothetical protein [Candidatus Gracilibacteria bacterium]
MKIGIKLEKSGVDGFVSLRYSIAKSNFPMTSKTSQPNFNISYFGSCSFSVPILEDISIHQGQLLGDIAKKQFTKLSSKHKEFLNIEPEFWNELKKDSNVWSHKVLQKPINLQVVVTKSASTNRGKAFTNPIQEYCERKAISWLSPNNLKDEFAIVKKFLKNTDIAIVASYGQIIPSIALALSKYGYLNWHPSKLPEYRGPSPVQAAISNGDKVTALSWIALVPQMDAGDIYFQDEVRIDKDDTFSDIIKKMALLGSQTWAMIAAIKVLEEQNSQEDSLLTTFAPRRQDFEKATITSKINKDKKFLDPEKFDAHTIYNHYRAFIEFPGSWLKIKYFGGYIKIIQILGVFDEEQFKNICKESISLNHIKDLFIIKNKTQRLFIKCKHGYLELSKICTPEGKGLNISGYNFNDDAN